MFKKFFIQHRHSETYDFCYPHNKSKIISAEKPFIFPCSDFERYEHGIYVVVLTEISGNKNFVTTRFIKECDFSIAFESDHPWFEIIYSLINNVITYKLYLQENWKSLEKYLDDLLFLPYPEPGVVFYIPSADFSASADKIVVPMKSRQKPFSVFLISLHKQLQFQDWIVIFESLLLERWIVFHSRHLNRVTNCIFAALALIFPLEWVHLIFPCLSESSINCLGCPSPFLAGIHSCLIDKVLPFLSAGALIVNIDEGTLHFVTSDSDFDPEDEGMPKCLVNFLHRNISDSELKMYESRKVGINKEEVKRACRLVVNGFLNTIAVLLGKYKSCTTWNQTANRHSINNSMLSESRGEILQPFIAKILQSQMVHQFLDDLINQSSSSKGESLTFAVDDIDDFNEACRAMSRWQTDHYVEVIANMASRSRRKINDIAIKMRDIARKSPFRSEMIENGDHRSMHNSINVKPRIPSLPTSLKEAIPVESEISKNNWITFDDNLKNQENLFSGIWGNNLGNGEKFDILQFEESNDVDWTAEKREDKVGLPVVVRDFDPLYQD